MEAKLISRYEFTAKKNPNNGILGRYPDEQINSDEKACNIIRDIFEADGCCTLLKEYCYAVLLDQAAHCIGYIRISEGNTTTTVFDSKLVIKACLDCGANGVILTHNHPSNNMTPSDSDIRETKTLKSACVIFGIRLVDHIIMGSDRYYSFANMDSFRIKKQ